ncbi:hypothetical protein HYU06_03385 [Candidatus Woesearchaeota archaeon]|nr:hypothetical protein [Candidatus Woesearchaeota archaeon]
MPTLTLAISADLKNEMDTMPELNWSEIAREAIAKKASEFKLFKAIVAKSKLKQEDAIVIGEKIKEDIYREYKKRLKEMK